MSASMEKIHPSGLMQSEDAESSSSGEGAITAQSNSALLASLDLKSNGANLKSIVTALKSAHQEAIMTPIDADRHIAIERLEAFLITVASTAASLSSPIVNTTTVKMAGSTSNSVNSQSASSFAASIGKEVEGAILRLCHLLKGSLLTGNASDGPSKSIVSEPLSWPNLPALIRHLEAIWTILPRPKTSRLLRALLDSFPPSKIFRPFTINASSNATASNANLISNNSLNSQWDSLEAQLSLVRDLAAWAERDGRVFLKQTLHSRLATLLLARGRHTEALEVVSDLLRSLKRLDDRLGLVEVHLIESRIHFQLQNGPRSRAALTAARSAANSVYVPPPLQAALDMQSAYVHAEEGDFVTASSYLVEACESFAASGNGSKAISNTSTSTTTTTTTTMNIGTGVDRNGGVLALKYLILCKIMLGRVDEIDSLLTSKLAAPFVMGSGDLEEVKGMVAVGAAYRDSSLGAFESALAAHPVDLGGDMLIHAHFQTLYDRLLIANLLSLCAPYSRVPIEHIAQAIGLPSSVVEAKLSVMVLDGHLDAVIDQKSGVLVVRDAEDKNAVPPIQSKSNDVDGTLRNGIAALSSLQTVVDHLIATASAH